MVKKVNCASNDTVPAIFSALLYNLTINDTFYSYYSLLNKYQNNIDTSLIEIFSEIDHLLHDIAPEEFDISLTFSKTRTVTEDIINHYQTYLPYFEKIRLILKHSLQDSDQPIIMLHTAPTDLQDVLIAQNALAMKSGPQIPYFVEICEQESETEILSQINTLVKLGFTSLYHIASGYPVFVQNLIDNMGKEVSIRSFSLNISLNLHVIFDCLQKIITIDTTKNILDFMTEYFTNQFDVALQTKSMEGISNHYLTRGGRERYLQVVEHWIRFIRDNYSKPYDPKLFYYLLSRDGRGLYFINNPPPDGDEVILFRQITDRDAMIR